MVTKIRQEDGRIACFENLEVKDGVILADKCWFEPMTQDDSSKKQSEVEEFDKEMRRLKMKGIDISNSHEVICELLREIKMQRKRIGRVFEALYDQSY